MMAQSTPVPIYEIKGTYSEYFFNFILLGATGIGCVLSLINVWIVGWECLTPAACCLVFYLLTRRRLKEYFLFADKLVVKRPLAFPKSKDDVFVASDIKEVIFRKVSGIYGGAHMIIMCKKECTKHIG